MDNNMKLYCRRKTMRRILSLVTTKVTFKITQSHWYSYHSICHTWFTISLPL